MFFSIIIPVYNVEDYIHQCLATVYNQSFYDYEVILIDDGSTDSSGLICDEYKGRHKNTKVLHKANDGLYQARIDGVRCSCGEWILFVDSDDFLMLDSLKILSGYIENNKDVNFDVIIFNSCINGNNSNMNSHGIRVGKYEKESLKDIYDILFRTTAINAVWKKCYRKNVIRNNEYLGDIHNFCYGEDLYITTAVFMKAKVIRIIDEVLYSYRLNVASMTHNYSRSRTKDEEISFQNARLLAVKLDEINSKWNYSKESMNLITKECLAELWSLFESNLSKQEMKEELNYLSNSHLFKTGMKNIDYHPQIWWEKFLYAGIRTNIKKEKLVRIYTLVKTFKKWKRIVKKMFYED